MLEKTLTQVRLSQGVDGRTEGQGFRGAAWGRPRQQGLRVSEHIPITGWDQRRRDRVSSGGGRESGVRGRRGAHSPGAGAARAAEDTKTQGPPGVPQEPCRDTGTPGPPQGRRQDAGTPRPQQERCPAHTLTLAMTLTPDLRPLNCQRINTLSEDPVCQNPLRWQRSGQHTHVGAHAPPWTSLGTYPNWTPATTPRSRVGGPRSGPCRSLALHPAMSPEGGGAQARVLADAASLSGDCRVQTGVSRWAQEAITKNHRVGGPDSGHLASRSPGGWTSGPGAGRLDSWGGLPLWPTDSCPLDRALSELWCLFLC